MQLHATHGFFQFTCLAHFVKLIIIKTMSLIRIDASTQLWFNRIGTGIKESKKKKISPKILTYIFIDQYLHFACLKNAKQDIQFLRQFSERKSQTLYRRQPESRGTCRIFRFTTSIRIAALQDSFSRSLPFPKVAFFRQFTTYRLFSTNILLKFLPIWTSSFSSKFILF